MFFDAHIDTPWILAKYNEWDYDIGSIPHSITTLADAREAVFVCYVPQSWHDRGMGEEILTRQAEWAGRQGVKIALEGWSSVSKEWVEKYKPSYITLVHAFTNELCESCTDLTGGGLSPQGVEAVKWLQANNIRVDISHASPQACWDVLRISKAPVIASHSGVAEVTPHPRNLSSTLIKEIATTGGVVGVPLVRNFVKDLPTLKRHIDVVGSIGINALGFGTDRDGAVLIPEVSSLGWKNTLRDILRPEDLQLAAGNFLKLL